MKVTVGTLRRMVREALDNAYTGYPFGERQPMPEEQPGSMPHQYDHPVLPVEAQEVDEMYGLDTDVFFGEEEPFVQVRQDPYVRDAVRLR